MATLGEQAVGSIVKLNVNGTARNFIVVHQGLPGSMYDASCDGTWLLMEDLYESRVWDSSNHDYENSDIHNYLNNTFVNLFDSDIKSAIKQVKIPYTKGAGKGGTLATGSSGLSAKVFLISFVETGYTGGDVKVEGSSLGYFDSGGNSKRVAKLNGTATAWWLRSPNTRYNYSTFIINDDGKMSRRDIETSNGVRPALVLPSELNLPGGAITGQLNIGGIMKELTGEGYINIGGVLRELSDSQVNIGGILESLKG